MDLDPANAAVAIQNGWAQLSALAVSYSMSVLGAVLLLIAGWFIAGFAQRSVYAGLGKIPGFDQTLRRFFSMVLRYAVLVLVIIMVLGQFGVQTASIIAALGAIGLAVGLALQGTLQNIAAGIMLLVLRPLRIGESIEVGSVSGTVEDIGLFATQFRTADGVYLLAPNSTLWNQPVRNYSRNMTRKAEITVVMKPGADIDRALGLLVAAARDDRRVQANPAPTAIVTDLGADGEATLALRFWTSPADFGAAKADVSRRVHDTMVERAENAA